MSEAMHDRNRWVEISFDCLPLRSIERLDIPLDASPKFRAHCERIKVAMEKHGTLNTYYVRNARCVFHLTNDTTRGMLEFAVEGTILTDADDLHTQGSDLAITLQRETCDWISEPIVNWFTQAVARAMEVEFDRYIAAGDLQRTRERLEKLRAQADAQGGYLGMYL